jgi:DNA ligase-1
MNISELFKTFKIIEETSSRLKITFHLANLFNRIDDYEINKVVYLTQGRICPVFIRKEFGLGEKLIIKGIIKGFQIEKDVFNKKYYEQGDVGKTIEYFRSNIHTIEETEISISSMFALLSDLTFYEGKGSQDSKLNSFMSLLRSADPLSCRYLVRIPTNTLRLGFSDMTILDALSIMVGGSKKDRPEIERAYNVRPDLGFIAHSLKKYGIDGIKNVKPILFTPIRMMLAERVGSAEELIKNAGTCFIESKYDGLRLQAHIDTVSKKVVLYSRSLDDVTLMYPDICRNLLEAVSSKSCILEGEAVGFDTKTGQSLSFQHTIQRKRKYDIQQKQTEIPLRYFVFDLLFADGESFLQKPFYERRNKLESIIHKQSALIVTTTVQKIDNVDGTEKAFHKASHDGFEGIMAKKIDAVYQAGARGWSWIKYKKSYGAKTADTIDCLVMGYDYGKGKRTGFGIGAFLVGVFDHEKEKYVTVAKIGTGLTDIEWRELKSRNNKIQTKEQPKQYLVTKEMNVDVWVKPFIVMEIRVDEVTVSDLHTAGYAFRFPRLERFRDDKKPEDVTELTELVKLFSLQQRH